MPHGPRSGIYPSALQAPGAVGAVPAPHIHGTTPRPRKPTALATTQPLSPPRIQPPSAEPPASPPPRSVPLPQSTRNRTSRSHLVSRPHCLLAFPEMILPLIFFGTARSQTVSRRRWGRPLDNSTSLARQLRARCGRNVAGCADEHAEDAVPESEDRGAQHAD